MSEISLQDTEKVPSVYVNLAFWGLFKSGDDLEWVDIALVITIYDNVDACKT
jgi:hypothetical protein